MDTATRTGHLRPTRGPGDSTLLRRGLLMKLITLVELSTFKQNATATWSEAAGDKVVADFRARIDKGNRYLATLRDMDPKPQEKIDAAIERLAGIERELRDFRVKYELPLR